MLYINQNLSEIKEKMEKRSPGKKDGGTSSTNTEFLSRECLD